MAAKRSPGVHTFSVRIARVGRGVPMFLITVPAKVSQAFGMRGYVPVLVTVNAVPDVHATLIPKGGGRHVLHLNSKVRKRAGVEAGDLVKLTVAYDHHPPEDATPPDLAFALRDEDALATWEKMARGKRNHIIRWIEEAAMETTREKRIVKTVSVVLGVREKAMDRALAAEARKRRAGT